LTGVRFHPNILPPPRNFPRSAGDLCRQMNSEKEPSLKRAPFILRSIFHHFPACAEKTLRHPQSKRSVRTYSRAHCLLNPFLLTGRKDFRMLFSIWQHLYRRHTPFYMKLIMRLLRRKHKRKPSHTLRPGSFILSVFCRRLARMFLEHPAEILHR